MKCHSMLRGPKHPWALGIGAVLLLSLVAKAPAQQMPPTSGIYTCTDANGRKLRSDRPIQACLDREQTVLNPSGTVRARIGPSLSTHQRIELDERKKEEEAERARVVEERRRDRAILARYPTREAHDKERAVAHARLDVIVRDAEKRIATLHEERSRIDRELEFYRGDPAKAPPAIQRQIDIVAQGLQAQQRFIQAHESERQRVDARFDEELARLMALWQEQKGGGGMTPRAQTRP